MRIQAKKWTTLIVSCLVMATAGSLFTFSVFSDGLRQKFKYTSSDVNLISGVGNTALYVSFLIVGPLYDKLGVTFTMAMSTFTYGLGYLMMWMAYAGRLGPEVSPLMMSIFYFLAGYGSTAAYMATIGVNMVNFKAKYSGLVTAVLMLFYGMSGSIFSQIYSAFYAQVTDGQDNTGGFLMFLFISTTLVNFICTFCIFHVPYSEERALLLGSIEGKALANPIPETLKSARTTGETDEIPLVNRQAPPKSYTETTGLSPPDIEATVSQNETEQGLSPAQILMSGVFWLFTLTYILQQGLTYVTNVTSIIQALEGKQADPTRISKTGADHVTLISLAQSASRFLFGILADIIGVHLGYDRSFLLVVAELFLLLPMLTLAIGTDKIDVGVNLLWMCSVFVGFGWGAAGALFPPLTKDFFGNSLCFCACLRFPHLICAFRVKMVRHGLWFCHVWCTSRNHLFKPNLRHILRQ